eukprot:6097139-Amphidinium_carterae.2
MKCQYPDVSQVAPCDAFTTVVLAKLNLKNAEVRWSSARGLATEYMSSLSPKDPSCVLPAMLQSNLPPSTQRR